VIEGIQGQSTASTLVSNPLHRPGAPDGFHALLNRLLDAANASASGQKGQVAAAPASVFPARVGLSQALHFLSVRVLPSPLAPLLPTKALLSTAARQARSLAASEARQVAIATERPSARAAISDKAAERPLALQDYPRPPSDNGRGVHWIPTTRQAHEVVDRFVERVKDLGMRWVTFLNEPGDLTGNEHLVRSLVAAGVMPIMRIYTEGGAPIQGDITSLVRRYRSLGVPYFQLFNEPNLRVENQGETPDVDRYLSLWIPAARQVVAGGGLPGLGALSPQGDVDDLDFLRRILEGLKARGAEDLLNRAWISVHNYGTDHLRVREYDRIVREVLGRSLPLIGTEAGVYAEGSMTEEEQVRTVTEVYRSLAGREPYYFAYSYWVLANQAGGGHDARWEYQALYRADGPTPLARALEAIG
jgi:hypothetical protein